MFKNNPSFQYTHTDSHGTRWFVLCSDLRYSMSFNGNGWMEITVPAGFETNFASVPRLLWRVLPPIGDYWRSAILHDYLYSQDCTCSRFLADSMFRDAMYADGVPLLQRVAMYYAVRLFGGPNFRTK